MVGKGERCQITRFDHPKSAIDIRGNQTSEGRSKTELNAPDRNLTHDERSVHASFQTAQGTQVLTER